jgi:hypothetical protein
VLICALLQCFQAFSQKPDAIVKLELRCGAGGQVGNEVAYFKQLHQSKDVGTIRAKLLEGTQPERIISAIWLLHYKDSVYLSLDEIKEIRLLSRQKQEYSICSGCTFLEVGTLRRLFSPKGKGLRDFVMLFVQESS